MGVKLESFEIEQVQMANHFLGCLIRNRLSNFRFWIINVYGPAQHEFSEDFILEITNFCAMEPLPIILGGDFNLIRSNKDRNQGQGDPKLMEMFNNFIGSFHLREIFVNGVKYTWSNKQKNPTLIKLDRILATACWDLNYPNSFAWSKARIGSDHSPLIIDTGEQGTSKPKYFYFEEKWIHHEGFHDLFKLKWGKFKDKFVPSAYSLDIWHGCLQSLRQYLRGWSLKIAGEIKEIKKNYSKQD